MRRHVACSGSLSRGCTCSAGTRRAGAPVAARLLARRIADMALSTLSRSDEATQQLAEMVAITQDLRRQRADLERIRRSSEASSAETTLIVDRIQQLRRRLADLPINDGQAT